MRVVIFKEDDLWIAQALEHDICAHADNEEAVREQLHLMLQLERSYSADNGKRPFEGIEPAPDEFQQLWSQCSELEMQPSSNGDCIQFALCA